MPKCVIHDEAVEAGLIEMCDMKPLQIGRVEVKNLNFNGHLVMRTSSTDSHEVMNLTKFRAGRCWGGGSCLKVRLLTKPVTITLSNED